MKTKIEIYTLKTFSIKENLLIKTALNHNGFILPYSIGSDNYGFTSIITSEKRIAGLGRKVLYSLSSFPAGLGAIEAKPGKYFEMKNSFENLALNIHTNYFPDIEVFRSLFGIRLTNEQEKSISIPLARPDLLIQKGDKGEYICNLNILEKPLYHLIK